MALFSKKQLLKVIEWNDDSTDTIVYRYPVTDREEIMNSSTLVVRPSQVALFVHKGQICDVFAPGTYKLATENIPFITKILSLPTGGESPIKAEVYYVNTKQMTGLKWGTQNPIMLRDKEFGAVRVRAFGTYSFKVEDAKKFMETMAGTNGLVKSSFVIEQVKPFVIQTFTDAVAESKISALDLAANYREFSKTIVNEAVEDFDNYGLKLCTMIIENISLPKEVEETLDTRSKMGIMEDKMGTYAQFESLQAMRDAAKNPGNGVAGMGMGMATGIAMGNMYAQNIQNIQNPQKQAPVENKPAAGGEKSCPKCGAKVSANAKFCPECGEKIPQAKFCPECGSKIDNPNAKFCPECGGKL